MDARGTGLFLIAIGTAVVIAGLPAWRGVRSSFGRLPGDFRYEDERTKVHNPLVSLLLVSMVLSLIAATGRWFL